MLKTFQRKPEKDRSVWAQNFEIPLQCTFNQSEEKTIHSSFIKKSISHWRFLIDVTRAFIGGKGTQSKIKGKVSSFIGYFFWESNT